MYHNLEMWQRSMRLVQEIYKIARFFPMDNTITKIPYKLRKLSVNVPLNISRGFVFDNQLNFSNYIILAINTLEEIKELLKQSYELKFIEISQKESLDFEINQIIQLMKKYTEKIECPKNLII
ncbi:MAG: four helix bundle protein [Bacteroidota bacterium]